MADFDTTTGAELVPPEYISNWIDEYGYPAATALLVGASIPTIGSIPYRMPRWNSISVPAGTKTEGQDFTEANPTLEEETGTPGIVGMEIPITDEIVAGAVAGVPAGVIAGGVSAMVNRMDVDGHSVSTSATNINGAFTDVFNKTKMSSCATQYRALEIAGGDMMQHALVLSHAGARDLETEEVLSAAARMVDGSFKPFAASSGYRGSYGGFQLFESGNVAVDGGGRSNYITPIGNNRSGLAFGISQGVVVESNRGSEGARSARSFHVFRAWYFAALRNRERILECRSRA